MELDFGELTEREGAGKKAMTFLLLIEGLWARKMMKIMNKWH